MVNNGSIRLHLSFYKGFLKGKFSVQCRIGFGLASTSVAEYVCRNKNIYFCLEILNYLNLNKMHLSQFGHLYANITF